MRRTLFASIVLAGLVTLASARPALGDVQVSVSAFHQTLAPYGRWVATASYGSVWTPSVAVGWQPYVNGEWYYTDYGWTWASSDPWGDIPFHYGTWAWVPPYGWVWVPGTVWAPAWVTWAYSDDYIGWAPVPPSFALSVSGYVGAPIVLASSRYVFVPTRQFVGVGVASARVPLSRNTAVFAHTTRTTQFHVANGVLQNVGPAPQNIARVSGHRVEAVPASRANVSPVSLSQSGVAHKRGFAVVASKADRAAAASKASPATHNRPSRNTGTSHRESPANVNERSSEAPRSAPAPRVNSEKAQPETAVAKPSTHEHAAAKTETTSSRAAKPAPKPEKHVAKPPKPEPQPEAARHEAPPPERVAAERPAPKSQAAEARPHPQPKPQKPNPQKPKQPQTPSPNPKNDGNGN